MTARQTCGKICPSRGRRRDGSQPTNYRNGFTDHLLNPKKEGITMTFAELYIFFLPLINILGTLCLIALSAGSVLFLMVWIIRRIWKGIVAIGVFSFFVFMAMTVCSFM